MDAERTVGTADVEVVIRGDIPDTIRAEAASKIREVTENIGEPILHARVRLTRSANPSVDRPVLAQANLDVNGRLVRAQVAGTTAEEAVDLLQAKLRHRWAHLERDWEARRGGQPVSGPHEWRHGSEPTHRPSYFQRPAEEREVVRHKAFELARATVDEAADDLERLDYDFHLFTDSATGLDTVIYRAGPAGLRLAQLAPDPSWQPVTEVPVTVSRQHAPRLDVPEAIERLGLTGLPFLFFADSTSGRGCVLYMRYDGDYGLITPAG
ncbi:HPF/RaiA family ribosome-associated protein [Microlunatus panaciterrae]|uniref:Ribosome-associated translation inhibitor RaiA n=1 Tax=Microlunatus panaciterrae TaxID=400768 RepID=A0ABS2RN76_9ACTN|nr:ribosome-associated translation inhibitor RaiA [Microlunatus panaciterrae]